MHGKKSLRHIIGLEAEYVYYLSENSPKYYLSRLTQFSLVKYQPEGDNLKNLKPVSREIDISPVSYYAGCPDVGRGKEWIFAYRDNFNEVFNIYKGKFEERHGELVCLIMVKDDIHVNRIYPLPIFLTLLTLSLEQYVHFNPLPWIIWPTVVFYAWTYSQLMRSRVYGLRWFSSVFNG